MLMHTFKGVRDVVGVFHRGAWFRLGFARQTTACGAPVRVAAPGLPGLGGRLIHAGGNWYAVRHGDEVFRFRVTYPGHPGWPGTVEVGIEAGPSWRFAWAAAGKNVRRGKDELYELPDGSRAARTAHRKV
jgi:hypothetical protein